MNWLQNVGDTDILRDATSASVVFWYRARRSLLLVAGAIAFTVLLAVLTGLLALGPQGTGRPWLRREWLSVVVSMLTLGWVSYCGWLAFKFLPSRNDRVVLRLRDVVRTRIAPLREKMHALTGDQLLAKTAEFRARLAKGESLDDIRPEAYASVREASRRGLLPYDFLDEARKDEQTHAREVQQRAGAAVRAVFRPGAPDFSVARAQRQAMQAELAAVNQPRPPAPHAQFECQLIGGQVLENCNVAEMRTGEGKTIVCYMAL
jgi:hypothetical protein